MGTRNMARSMPYNNVERLAYVIKITTLATPAIRQYYQGKSWDLKLEVSCQETTVSAPLTAPFTHFR